MARGSLSSDPSMDFACSGLGGGSFSAPQAGPSSRCSSVLSSVVPYLRRMDSINSLPPQKVPLLTLKLSSPSFIDSVVTDDVTGQPLYIIRTSRVLTKIKRADPWDGETNTAEIQWPRSAPAKGKGISDGVLIQMRGSLWKGSETLLRRGSILGHVFASAPTPMLTNLYSIYSGPRKFNIPNYSQNLKWRCVGDSYWCTTAAVKGPIAILYPATHSCGPQLSVFETLHDKYDARPMLVHHGVSILLLDYLLVTALLLVTDIQDWMLVDKIEDIVVPIGNLRDPPGMSPPKPGNISISSVQWRKIVYGEPLFPKSTSRSSTGSDSTTPDSLTPTTLPTEQMAKAAYGHPLYPSIRSSTPTPSISSSKSTSDHLFFSSPVSTSMSRPASPSAESIFYPRSRSNAPSHTYLDPSFYNGDDIPPVPPLPDRFMISTSPDGSSRASRSRPHRNVSPTNSSNENGAHDSMRRLPDPPLLPIPPLVLRTQSTSTRSLTPPTTPRTNEHSDLMSSRPLDSPATPSTPRRPSRQLPQPPTTNTRSPPMSTSLPVRTDSKYIGMGVGRARSRSQLPALPASTPQARQSEDASHVKRAEEWVMVAAEESRAGARPGSVYDTPPPAYNSIFSQGGERVRRRGEVTSGLPKP